MSRVLEIKMERAHESMDKKMGSAERANQNGPYHRMKIQYSSSTCYNNENDVQVKCTGEKWAFPFDRLIERWKKSKIIISVIWSSVGGMMRYVWMYFGTNWWPFRVNSNIIIEFCFFCSRFMASSFRLWIIHNDQFIRDGFIEFFAITRFCVGCMMVIISGSLESNRI